MSSLFASGGDGESLEIFDPEIKYPENPEQYKKDFTFTLPDALTEEERASVKGVVLEATVRSATAAHIKGLNLLPGPASRLDNRYVMFFQTSVMK